MKTKLTNMGVKRRMIEPELKLAIEIEIEIAKKSYCLLEYIHKP